MSQESPTRASVRPGTQKSVRPGTQNSVRPETQKFYVTTFYKFVRLNELESIQSRLQKLADEFDITGLVILGPEGINSTVAATSPEGLNAIKDLARQIAGDENLFFKNSESTVSPFRRFSVKIRDEIVTLGTPGLAPFEMSKNHHLTPAEWSRAMEEEDVVLIDTRNWYETQIGTFKNALVPDIDQFTEFPEYLEKQGIAKDKKMLIFCTGGIRCEKGILDLQKQGYVQVFQLEGGIINYIKEFPNEKFEGECFVFDHRVALDQDLRPTTRYGLCPHCGQPAKTKVTCRRCDTEAFVCDDCQGQDFKKETCSKNCAHHFQLHPERKGPRQTNGSKPVARS